MQNNQLTPQNKDLLSIGEASEYLGISIDTLRRWEKKGRIEPFRSPGGHRYFEKKQLDNLFGKKYERIEPTIRKSTGAKETVKSQKPIEEEREFQREEDIVTVETIEKEVFIIDRAPRQVSIPMPSPLRIIQNISPYLPQFAQQEPQPAINHSILTPPISTSPPSPEVSPKTITPPKEKVNYFELLRKNKKVTIIVIMTIISVAFAITVAVWTSSRQILSPIP